VRRRRVLGVTVLGGLEDIAAVLEAARPDEVVVTVPAADPDRLAEVFRVCEAAGLPCRLLRRTLEVVAPPLAEVQR
jgi:FlaA1/EpsC-like NDP-sugar epimerase